MGSASWQPKWWTEENHGSAWSKVKDALKRDWDQTKADLSIGGRELDQNVGDTVKQAAGKEAIPAAGVPNTEANTGTRRNTDLSWEEAEQPLMYGYGARHQYGAQHQKWDDGLETTLKNDWNSAGNGVKRKWDEVKSVVRHGYDRARS